VDLERLGSRAGGIKPFLSNSIVITLAALAREGKEWGDAVVGQCVHRWQFGGDGSTF